MSDLNIHEAQAFYIQHAKTTQETINKLTTEQQKLFYEALNVVKKGGMETIQLLANLYSSDEVVSSAIGRGKLQDLSKTIKNMEKEENSLREKSDTEKLLESVRKKIGPKEEDQMFMAFWNIKDENVRKDFLQALAKEDDSAKREQLYTKDFGKEVNQEEIKEQKEVSQKQTDNINPKNLKSAFSIFKKAESCLRSFREKIKTQTSTSFRITLNLTNLLYKFHEDKDKNLQS